MTNDLGDFIYLRHGYILTGPQENFVLYDIQKGIQM